MWSYMKPSRFVSDRCRVTCVKFAFNLLQFCDCHCTTFKALGNGDKSGPVLFSCRRERHSSRTAHVPWRVRHLHIEHDSVNTRTVPSELTQSRTIHDLCSRLLRADLTISLHEFYIKTTRFDCTAIAGPAAMSGTSEYLLTATTVARHSTTADFAPGARNLAVPPGESRWIIRYVADSKPEYRFALLWKNDVIQKTAK